MTDDQIKEIVNGRLMDEFEIEEEQLVPSAHIKDDLKMDSLDIVDLVVVLEQAFDMKIPNRSELVNIRTLGDIYTYLFALRDSGIVRKDG